MWTKRVPLIHSFLFVCFLINTCTVFNPWLGVHEYEGLTACFVLWLFYIRHLSFAYFGIHSVPETNPHGYRGTTNLGGSHSYRWIFDGAGLGAPHPQVFQGANVFYNVVLISMLIVVNISLGL